MKRNIQTYIKIKNRWIGDFVKHKGVAIVEKKSKVSNLGGVVLYKLNCIGNGFVVGGRDLN